MTDIFEVQDEITSEILVALNARIGQHLTPRKFPGTEAYNAFQRGRYHLVLYQFRRALEWLDRATTLDPSNADAWADRARVLSLQTYGGQFPNTGDHLERRRDYQARALEINPNQANALGLQALMDTFCVDRDYQRSVNQLVSLVKANPNHEEPHRYLSIVLLAIGRTDLGHQVGRRTVEIAPLSRVAMQPEVIQLLSSGRVDEARRALEKFSRLGMKDDPESAAQLAMVDRDTDAIHSSV